MKKYSTLLILTLFVSGSCLANSFFVDATKGDDQQNGLTPATAWSSLSRVNSAVFKPGDTIFFKRGQQWKGTLWPKGSGSKGNRIVIAAYGEGALPSIDGEGKIVDQSIMSAGLILFNQEYWEIRDLEIRNFET